MFHEIIEEYIKTLKIKEKVSVLIRSSLNIPFHSNPPKPQQPIFIMQTIAVVLALVAVASAGVVSPVAYGPTVISRAPAFDSAVIKSDRLGGNFAYSVQESHAYAAHTPIVQHVTSPVAVSYSAPAVTYAAQPVAYAAQPIAYAQQQVVRSVAAPAVATYAAGPYGVYGGAYGYASPYATTLLK